MTDQRQSTRDEEMELALKTGREQFKRLMEKNGKLHWLITEAAFLRKRLSAKVAEANALGMTWELAADIANYAAMLADKQEGQT